MWDNFTAPTNFYRRPRPPTRRPYRRVYPQARVKRVPWGPAHPAFPAQSQVGHCEGTRLGHLNPGRKCK
jgi:hypothetical protein